MAFVPPTALPTRGSTHRTRPKTSRPTRPPLTSTAAANRPTATRSTATIRPHRSAPVIDNHISSVVENHHWITVRPDRRRLFERAAVAHADMTRQVERRTGTGAAHRWVLRGVGGVVGGGGVAVREGTYVVMETYGKQVPEESPQVMRRWLSAVERVAPMMATLDIRTRGYENLFTSRLHRGKYDPNHNVVVMESVNVDYGKEEEVMGVLRDVAERAVSGGNCLEFSVLRKPGKVGFFKVLQVFRDDDSLRQHMDGLDKEFDARVQGKTAGGARNRQMFRPVVFA